MYAIIETGGKQYRVQEGDMLNVEKLPAEDGESVEIDKVLAVVDGEEIKIGTPLVQGAKVVLKVLRNGRDERLSCSSSKQRKTTGASRVTDSPFPVF